MRVMLLGAGGMIAHDLLTTAPAGVSVVPFPHSILDITNAFSVRERVAEQRPDIVINAAAYTAVDQAKEERDLAFHVNGDGAGNVARIAGEQGARLVHFSTEYVFDGSSQDAYRETDSPNPINDYGESKLDGERKVAASGVPYLLIRTQWLFGARGRSFPRTMWERAMARVPTNVVNDEVGRPTYAADLARATWTLIAAEASGLIHVANGGQATRYELARRIFDAAGAGSLVRPCSTHEFPRPARRPPRAILSTEKFERMCGQQLPSWEDALDRFLAGMQ